MRKVRVFGAGERMNGHRTRRSNCSERCLRATPWLNAELIRFNEPKARSRLALRHLRRRKRKHRRRLPPRVNFLASSKTHLGSRGLNPARPPTLPIESSVCSGNFRAGNVSVRVRTGNEFCRLAVCQHSSVLHKQLITSSPLPRQQILALAFN
jgi:hypothetical protein